MNFIMLLRIFLFIIFLYNAIPTSEFRIEKLLGSNVGLILFIYFFFSEGGDVNGRGAGGITYADRRMKRERIYTVGNISE